MNRASSGRLLLAGLMLLLTAQALLRIGSGSSPQAPPIQPRAEAETAADATPRREEALPPVMPEREAVTPPEPPPVEPWLAHPHLLELELLVVDELGLPVKGFTAEVAPVDGTLREIGPATDESGRTTLRLAARRPQVQIELLDPRRYRRLLTLTASRPTRLTLVQRATRGSLNGIHLRLAGPNFEAVGFPGSLDDDAGPATRHLHPFAWIDQPGVAQLRQSDEEVPGIAVSLSTGSFTFRRANGITFASGTFPAGGAPPDAAPPPTLRGSVFHEDGSPAVGEPVALLSPGDPQPQQRTETDAAGMFVFEGDVGGERVVRAGGGEHGLALLATQVDGTTPNVTLQLRREATIRGTLRTATGEVVPGASIEWQAADGSWADRTTTHDDGTFVLANLPRAAGRLLAFDPEREPSFPLACEPSVWPDAGEVLLTTLPPDVSLHFAIALPERLVEGTLRARIRQLATGFSINVPPESDGSQRTPTRRRIDHLPPDRYAVGVFAPGTGLLPLGQHWLEAGADCDLSTAALPTPGTVRFVLPPNEPPSNLQFELVALRPDFDVSLDDLTRLDQDVRLGAGDYALGTRRGDDGPVHWVRIHVLSGGSTDVPVTW